MAAGARRTIRLVEVFASIQGESTYAGLPCVMVRTAGCPLRCSYCDTRYAQDEEGGRPWPLDEVVARVERFGLGLVELTGGEPLHQSAAPALLRLLCDRGLTVLLETSGGLPVAGLDPRVRLVMDIKCPGSGMHRRLHRANLALLRPEDQVKLVLCHREDYDYARRIIAQHDLLVRCPVLLSPAEGRLDPALLARWMLEDRLAARLQLQLHRRIWPDEERGR